MKSFQSIQFCTTIQMARQRVHRARKRVHRDRKRGVHQASTETAAKSLVPSKVGGGFARCEECYEDVPINLIITHNCFPDMKNMEVKKKPAERDDVSKTGSKDVKGVGHPTTWPYLPDNIIKMVVRRAREAEAEATAATNAKSLVDGGGFARCECCYEDVPINLIITHNCFPDKKNLQAQVVEMAPEVKKKPAERDDVSKTGSKDVKGVGHPTTWPYLPDNIIKMVVRRAREAEAEATAATNAKSLVDGGGFARCECYEDVPINLIITHNCFPDKKNLEAQVVEMAPEVKKKPAERKEPTSTAPKSKRVKKDPNKPKHPATAFFIFMDDFRKIFKEANPGGSKDVKRVAKEAGEKWKSMSDEEKKQYTDKAAELKAEYNKAL